MPIYKCSVIYKLMILNYHRFRRIKHLTTGVRFAGRDGISSPHHRVQTGCGAHTASYAIGTSGSFPAVKRLGREADHSI
jgi:hypothetical protein